MEISVFISRNFLTKKEKEKKFQELFYSKFQIFHNNKHFEKAILTSKKQKNFPV